MLFKMEFPMKKMFTLVALIALLVQNPSTQCNDNLKTDSNKIARQALAFDLITEGLANECRKKQKKNYTLLMFIVGSLEGKIKAYLKIN